MAVKAEDFYAKSFISGIAAELLPEERRGSLVCPFCDGGKTRERSFGVAKSKDGAVYYKCFRVHCGKSGSTGQTRTNSSFHENKPPPVERFVLPPVQDVEGPWAPKLLGYGSWNEVPDETLELGWKTSDKGTCLWIPLRTCDEVHIGYESRPISGPIKSRIFRFQKETFVRNFIPTTSKESPRTTPTLVVEDSISALKARSICNTYSLQGTNFTQDHLFELTSYGEEGPILLALDRDATAKAAGLIRKFRFYSQFIRIAPLRKDVKHMTKDEIKELVDNPA